FSPFGQKMRYLLALAAIEYQRVNQPPVLPRPDLQEFGITHRRIPVLAIGKDIYCDTAAITKVVQQKLGSVPAGPAEKAFEAFGARLFDSMLHVVPATVLTETFKRDRETIFPVLSRPDYEEIRPSCLAGLRSVLGTIEDEFLAHGEGFIGGGQPSIADVHIAPLARWGLVTLGIGEEPGFGENDFPRVHAWIAGLPVVQPEEISGAQAAERILGARYLEERASVAADDALGIWAGRRVSVESADSTPGAHPQEGSLIGAGRDEVVVGLQTGVRLHFPRHGYIVKAA
ncbi:hypothetical protein B0J12DRAFT_585251, partial [Macrophomina phaseolina]